MAMFSNTDKTKTPYKFKKEQVTGLLKKYLPSLKMQEGDTYSVLVYTFQFDGRFHRDCITRYVIVHRHIDGAVLIFEDNYNRWGGASFSLFDLDGECSSVDVCESFDDFEGFLMQFSDNLENHTFNMSNLTQVPLEYASASDKPIKDFNGEYIRLPISTLDGSYKHKKGDFAKYSERIRARWEKYKEVAEKLLDMNPALSPFDVYA